MIEEQELLYTMALTMALRMQPKHQRTLYDTMGSATAVYECRRELSQRFEHFSERMADSVGTMAGLIPYCREELEYVRQHHIRVLHIADDDYPARLRQCEDAPLIIYTLGNLRLNAAHIISVVGTRRCTERGKELCSRLTRELAEAMPDTLVVSGLAYGIDIAAHRGALAAGLPTAGVLAHGLDEIYPSVHRQTAIAMLERGGLITEFTSHTPIDRLNFLRRNRIVAGLADAVVVVESPARGGSLNTARLAGDYHRDVFTFPGRPTDIASEGCNVLIRRNSAVLINSTADLLTDLGWSKAPGQESKQGLLFPEMSADEQTVVDALCAADSDLTQTDLALTLSMAPQKITPLILSLELKGVVRVLPGSRYHLVGR